MELVLSCIDYIVLCERMIVNNVGMMWKEAVMANFKVQVL
jgi:hypothetical protein